MAHIFKLVFVQSKNNLRRKQTSNKTIGKDHQPHKICAGNFFVSRVFYSTVLKCLHKKKVFLLDQPFNNSSPEDRT